MTSPDTDGQTIQLPFLFRSTTSVPVDTVHFVFLQGTVESGAFTAVNPDGQGKNWELNLGDGSLPPDAYTLVARASIAGQTTDSTAINLAIQSAVTVQTVSILTPTNNATLSNIVDFVAQTNDVAQSVQFVLTGVTGTPTEGTSQTLNAVQDPTDQTKWQLNPQFNTTALPNGQYSLVASATFAGTTSPVISQNLAVTISNQAQTTQPLVISTTSLPQGTVAQTYAGLLVAAGGTAPYTWSITNGTLPGGLTLQGGTGTVAGVPTTAGNTTLTFQVRDANANTATVTLTIAIAAQATTPPPTDPTTTPTQPTPTPTPIPTPTPVTTSLNISQPKAGNVSGANVLVVVTANVPIYAPDIQLLTSSGNNALATRNARGFQATADQLTWNYVLDSTTLPNGTYTLQAVARAQGATVNTTSNTVVVTIQNEAKPVTTFVSGTITAPKAGQRVSGRVLLNASINGTVRSVTFKISTNVGTTDVSGRQQAGSASVWEGSWDATSLPAGPFTVKASVETDTGETVTLQSVEAFIVATTAPLLVAPVPTEVPQPTIEQIVQPEVLQNVVPETGTLAQTPVECQIVAIRDEVRCREYLRTREIRLLTPAEQEKVRQDLAPIVARHIGVENGLAVTKDTPAAPVLTRPEARVVEDPLAEIIPFDKKQAKDVSLLVVSSTEPPANLKPFVLQTVPAVLTLDKDGDGLSDEAEERYGTDASNPDTDGDGYLDGLEVKNGFDPLGTGVLNKPIAPMDEAILNNRPVEQPRFAGAVDREKIKVDEVATASDDEEKALVFKGKSEPYSFVTLYIYSSLPIVVTVQADASGDWQYEFSHPLVDGKHDVYATVTNNTGKIVKKSEPLAFFVRGASAVTEDEFLATATVQDTSTVFLVYYILAGALIVLLGGGLFFYYLRRKEHFI